MIPTDCRRALLIAGLARCAARAPTPRQLFPGDGARIRTTSRRRRTAPSSTPRRCKGYLGRLDPEDRQGREHPARHGLGAARRRSSAPDGAAWITDGGLNANRALRSRRPRSSTTSCCRRNCRQRQPQHRRVRQGRRLWFTGQSGVYGYGRSGDRQGRKLEVAAPRQLRHHRHAVNEVWYVALAGDHLGKIDKATGDVDDRRAAQEGRRARAASGRIPKACSG